MGLALSLSHLSSLVIVSGISGAGRSTTLHKLEDLGFYVIDNLPVQLFPALIDFTASLPPERRKASVSLNIESTESVNSCIELLESVNEGKEKLSLIFLDSETQVILKRYSETRRPHPGYDASTDSTISDTIARERVLLAPLKFRANLALDTSALTVHDLRREVETLASGMLKEATPQMRVTLLSFGFKYGSPRDCDLIFDVRFLPNPHFEATLRHKTGLDEDVYNFVLNQEETGIFLGQVTDLLKFLLPRYVREGKAYLTVGIGCTGGKHRSVAMVEALTKSIGFDRGNGFLLSAFHRDIGLE